MVLTLSDEAFQTRKKAETNAISLLRGAIFIYILASIGYLVLISIVEITVMGSLFVNTPKNVKNSFMTIAFFIIAFGLNGVFMLLFVHALNNAILKIESFVPGAKISRIGAIIYAVITIIYVPIYAIFFTNQNALFITTMSIIMLIVIGSILIFLGMLLILIGLWRIGVHYQSGDLKIGVLLMLFLGFIGAIMVYTSLGSIEDRIKNRLPPPPVPPWLQ